MKGLKIVFVVLSLVLSAALFQAPSARGDGIFFNDSDPDTLLVGNSVYEIGLRKSNGSIVHIIDKSTGKSLTLGSRDECLWRVTSPRGRPASVGGCFYHATRANRFSYVWAADQNTLTLNYIPDPAAAQKITTQVVLIVSSEAWFDMRLRLDNQWGAPLDEIAFPADLVFAESDMKQALLPLMPGVIFEPGFFSQKRSFTGKYPAPFAGMFADYVWMSTAQGQIAMYSLYEPGPLKVTTMGFVHDDAYIRDSTFYRHNFGLRLSDRASWTSPRVRVRIAQSALETAQAFRLDNGLEKFRSLRDKLGSRYTQIAQSPIYKADAQQLKIPFTKYSDLLAKLPVPGILHPVAYQQRGHDENVPDFLPTDPAWGTIAEFAAMFRQAQSLGLLVMPYINPTWWDDESPTLQNLPPSVTTTSIALLNDQGAPLYEKYAEKGGYIVSPYVPFVQKRLEQLMREMTVDIPSDLVFEDQIGARPWFYDHNPSSPYPTSYVDGWLEHTRTYSQNLLMTEFGFDRLAETEVGFNGSALLHERRGSLPWGKDAWRIYPLAPMILRDKVLFYQHDLATPSMTHDKATLTWNLAYGYLLTYNLSNGVDNPFLQVAGAFQKHVLGRYADENITNFRTVEDRVTQTTFKTVTVTANWKDKDPYTMGGYTLAPLGLIVTDTNSTLTAGIFTGYNGAPLSAGEHYLIEERGQDEITIRQPLGSSTNLILRPLVSWSATDPIQASAYNKAGQFIATVPVTVTAQAITLNYQLLVAGQPVAFYKVTRKASAPTAAMP